MNVKRMEVMIDDLNENFQRHVAASTSSFHFVMPVGGEELELRFFAQGGDMEIETLLLSDSRSGDLRASIALDGEIISANVGAIAITTINIKRGRHTLNLSVCEGVDAAKARVCGAIFDVKVSRQNKTEQGEYNDVE